MDRSLMKDLVNWKSSTSRKPLIVNGARQVGKTWLLKEFGKKHFSNMVYVNFDDRNAVTQEFNNTFDTKHLLQTLEIYSNQNIKPNDTLIFLDEIQECPKALTSLKYFCEQCPEYAIAAAGSLLGITIHEGTGYPVGKVTTLNLYPLSFQEFLHAKGEDRLLHLIEVGQTNLLKSFSQQLNNLLKTYYYVGGMPEAVNHFFENEDFDKVRNIQNDILLGYERDISKHLSIKETEYTIAALRSVPEHLSRENKKFVFGHISNGARANNFKVGISWLCEAALTIKVPQISKANIPLSAYENNNAFKLYFCDVGLLCAMNKINPKTIIDGNKIFTEYKGAITEQFVCQQLLSACKLDPYYWTARNSSGEIDFLVQDYEDIFAIEVKAEKNLRSKSLAAFKKKNSHVHALRFSMADYKRQDWVTNIPLFAIGNKNLWT